MPKYKVFYRKNQQFFEDPSLYRLNVLNERTHALVKEVEFPDLETLFEQMQVLPWTKVWLEENVKADNAMLKSKGLHHTSMSVGDCALDTETDIIYEVEMCGWREIPAEVYPKDLALLNEIQTELIVLYLSSLHLKELRKRQDIANREIVLAGEQGLDAEVINAQIKLDHLTAAIMKKCFEAENA